MPLDPKFNKFSTASPFVASYSYTDIAEGTGMQKLYLFTSIITGPTSDEHLTGNIFYSADIFKGVAAGDASELDLDFDLTQFNIPKTIEGTGILNIPYTMESDGATNGTAYMIFQLKKNDVIIVTVQTPTAVDNGDSAASGKSAIWCLPLIIPQTIFAKGDVLRLTITSVRTGNPSFYIGIDPKNRAATPPFSKAFTATDGNMTLPFLLEF